MERKTKKFLLALIVILLVSVIFGKQLIFNESAEKPEVNHDPVLKFTQIVGTLDGADYEIFIPDNWNGMLVIGCRGHRTLEPEITNEYYMHSIAMYFMLEQDTERWAFAWSTYGEGGYCIEKGMIRTHQLTDYVIKNYNVQGKVFLIGISMGGTISCLLAEKYPNLYDGLLDVVGPKDLKVRYNSLIGLPDSGDLIKELEAECSGTPDEKPLEYEKRSPTYNADLKIPVISLYGEEDHNVPPIHAELFYDAVEATGSLEYYRSYMYPDYLHTSFYENTVVILHFLDLFAWVEENVEPPTHPYLQSANLF